MMREWNEDIIEWQFHSILVLGMCIKEYKGNEIVITWFITFICLATTNDIGVEWNMNNLYVDSKQEHASKQDKQCKFKLWITGSKLTD